jgi:hypothetical protein
MCHERWVQLGDESVERGWLRRLFDRERDEPTPPPEARPDEPPIAPEEEPERTPPALV